MTPGDLAYVGEESRQIGWRNCQRAYIEGGRDMARAATEVGVWLHPRHVELERIRNAPSTPCGRPRCVCSRCVRAAAVEANQTRYGQPDFPDAQTRAAILAGGTA